MKKSFGEEAVVPLERKLRSLPPTYAPSLVFSHGKKDRTQIFYTISDQLCHVRSIPEMRGSRYVASCHGWLILQSYHIKDLCYLFNPVFLTKIHLPPLPHNSFRVGALTCSPSDSTNCSVVLYSRRKMSLIFCQIGATNWSERNLRRDKEIRRLIYDSCDAISCNGKIYLNFCDSMLVISVHDNSAFVGVYKSPEYSEVTLQGAEFLEEFLVESCGQVFKVYVIQWEEDSMFRIRYCEVFKLDYSLMKFFKVDSIGDQIFMIGQYCSASFSTYGLGVIGNRIHILVPGHTIIHIFDMDDGSITTTEPCLERVPHWREPFWMVPNCNPNIVSQQDNKGVVKFEKSQEREGLNWKDLPVELVELILVSLSLGDSIPFRLTCKTWIPINPPVRSNLPLGSSEAAQKLPWLVSFPNINKGLCTFYHPIYGDSFTMNIPELSDAIIVEAKYGWLLMRQGLKKGPKTFFFFNPLTAESVILPEFEWEGSLCGITFSSLPTSLECIVFGFGHNCFSTGGTRLHVYDKRKDDDEYPWSDYCSYKGKECMFIAASCNPVYSDGLFYCLSKDGKVAVYDPNEENEELAWKILPVAPVFSYTEWKDFRNSVQCFILEHEGDIFSVFGGFTGKGVGIYKLDRQATKMKWVRLDCFGDKVAFLSPTGCMLLPAFLKGIQNRIYFSRFHDKNNMFYSLSDDKYRCFKCANSGKHCKSGCELWNCTWIQLNS